MRLHYEACGQGEPLVLLHGLAADWATDFRVVAPDLREHGRSPNPAPEFRHDAAAEDVLALLDELGVRTFKGLGVSGRRQCAAAPCRCGIRSG
jgi:pimeloyl-ACP methyl ester carboxylesterase